MEIRRVGADLFHVDERPDGKTNMMKVIVTYQNFATHLKM